MHHMQIGDHVSWNAPHKLPDTVTRWGTLISMGGTPDGLSVTVERLHTPINCRRTVILFADQITSFNKPFKVN